MSEDDTRGGVLGFAAAPPPRKPPWRTVVIAVAAVVVVIAVAVAAVLFSSRGESGTAVPTGVPNAESTTAAESSAGQGSSGVVRPAADRSLRLQPADAVAPGPFVTSPAAAPVEFTPAASAKIDAILAELVWDFGTETKLADGDAPALFAAEPNLAACDVAGIAQSLAGDQSVATAFSAALRIAPNQIAGYVGTLAPVALAHDTVVVNHDYVDGDAAAVTSVLQAGTPVLVDATGTPRVRCSGASPLAVPDGAGYPDFVLLGTPWAGFLVDEVLVIEPAVAVSALSVVDATSGKLVEVAVGGGNGAPAAAGELCTLPQQSSFADRLVAVSKTPDLVTCADMKQRWADYDGWVQSVGEGVGLVFTFGDNWTCTSRTNAQLASPTWSGTVGSCAARNVDDGAFTVYSADRYDPATGTSTAAGPSGSGPATGTAATTPAPATPAAPPAVAPPTAAARVPGDLGLSIAMTRPACDGSGIVIVGSAVNPGSYPADVQRILSLNPGAAYLRTDQACPSLNQATASGDPIYAVYFPAGSDQAAICGAVTRVGGDAYGKRLDTSSDPTAIVDC